MSDALRFGRYRVTETLGSGAMGTVYAAIDEVLGREVAIKTLRDASGVSARFIDERFRNEARAVASLAHPNVVQVYDVAVDASPPYLVMERVAGPSLKARIETGPLPLAELGALGVQIAQALAAAHERGIIHRDVKPANILAAGPRSWKLADFGVAHVPDSSLTMTGQFVGSPAYAAPEALTKGELGPPSDVYCLGAVLYEAASGRWPRSGPTSAPGIAALLEPPPPLARLAPDVPGPLAAIIDRAVDPQSTRRPTAHELAEAIAAWTGGGVAARPMRRSRRIVWILGAAALGATISVAATLSSRSEGAAPPPGPALLPVPELLPTTMTAPDAAPAAPVRSGPLRVNTPPGLAGKATKDWNKVVEHLSRGHLAEARRRLADFERTHGRTPETADLAAQLESVPEAPSSREERGNH